MKTLDIVVKFFDYVLLKLNVITSKLGSIMETDGILNEQQ